VPTFTLPIAMLAVVIATTSSNGQTLGDAARKAQQTRPAATKSYSDKDLKPVDADPLSTSDTFDTPAPTGPALSREEIVRRVSPAVVTIRAGMATGTGFFVRRGLILTNHHVVGDERSVQVHLVDGTTASGTVTATASDADLALVRVTIGKEPAALPLGRSRQLQAGEDVIAIGSALGMLQTTVTRGIVSAIRSINGLTYVQTDAAINPGNSGGPLVDKYGRVVGVTTAKMNGAESLGFAIATDHVGPLLAGQTSVADRSKASSSNAELASAFKTSPGPDSDTRHAQVLTGFDNAMKVVARSADSVDSAWRQYVEVCGGTSAASSGSRGWFSVLDGRDVSGGDPRSSCRSYRAQIVDRGQQISTAVQQAEEIARREGLFPGETRDIRRKYWLDWSGWDR
jgi:S1-C subfamily serine protease